MKETSQSQISFDETIIRNGKQSVELKNVDHPFDDVYPKGSSNIPLFVSQKNCEETEPRKVQS